MLESLGSWIPQQGATMAIKQSEYQQVVSQLNAANAKIAELEKKVQSEANTKEYYSKLHAESQAMLEQVHQVLDAMPNAIARKSDAEESWNRVERSPVTRLAAWLASRTHGPII
jgi:predicted  nucleic acid-binding Zn-ribbon protein